MNEFQLRPLAAVEINESGFMSFNECMNIAQTIASGLKNSANVIAVLLIGSLARGKRSTASDIDLAVFHSEPPTSSYEEGRIAGVSIGIEHYAFPSTEYCGDFFDVKGLREVGRFSNGVVLVSKSEIFDRSMTMWRHSLLSPKVAKAMCDAICAHISTALTVAYRVQAVDVLGLQQAADLAAVLILSTSPHRYQKPKWVIQDLRDSMELEMCDLLAQLCGESVIENVSVRLGQIHSALINGCVLGGLPAGFERANDEMVEYGLIRRTFKDAESLLADGDALGALYTAGSSLRLMMQYLSDLPASQCAGRDLAIRWLNSYETIVVPETMNLEEFSIATRSLQRLQAKAFLNYRSALRRYCTANQME